MTTRVSVFVMAAAAAACLAAAQLADAAVYRFEGDRGTVCTVEVGAKASDSLGALSGPPQVGYSSVPQCSYAKQPASPSAAKKKRVCRKGKKPGAKSAKKRRCKRGKRPGRSPRAYAATPAAPAVAVPTPALLDQARLELLGPGGGVTSVGEQTGAAAGLGYSCSVTLASTCSDSGRLLPATPGLAYTAQFSLHLSPPPGERWVKRPAAGCSAGAIAECALRSATVTPTL